MVRVRLRRVRDGKWFLGQTLSTPMVTSDMSRAKILNLDAIKRPLVGRSPEAA